LWLKIFGGFYPRSRKVSGCVAVRVRGREASAGEDAREPVERAGFSAKEIFGGFRRKRSPNDNFADFANFA
jgi:hypothetical protein